MNDVSFGKNRVRLQIVPAEATAAINVRRMAILMTTSSKAEGARDKQIASAAQTQSESYLE